MCILRPNDALSLEMRVESNTVVPDAKAPLVVS
jgi:hypothetical protein